MEDFFELPDTIHDLLTATRGKVNILTKRQNKWVNAYFSFCDKTGKEPTAADVARELGISRTASSKMKKRVMSILIPCLMPYFYQYNQDKDDDECQLTIQKSIENACREVPEYLEKRRGEKGYRHWRLSALAGGDIKSIAQERFGCDFYTGYVGKKIETLNGYEKLKIIHTTEHKSSVLSDWWYEKSRELSIRDNISFDESYSKLYSVIMAKWKKIEDSKKVAFPYKERLCRFCGQLLPLGEVIEGRKVTPRRLFCSNSCKIQHKRYSRKRKIAERGKSIFKKPPHHK